MRSNYNDGSTAERGEREGDEPAFVVTGKFDRNFRLRANAQANAAERDAAEPAPTITGGHDTGNRQWVADRPSTNVNGDPRISAPGHDDPAQSGSQQEGAIRVTVQEAAILQGFPPDYPWQGSRTAQFQQIGNAVPPPLALAVLAALLGVDVEPIAGCGGTDARDGVVAQARVSGPGARRDPRSLDEPSYTLRANAGGGREGAGRSGGVEWLTEDGHA